MLDESASEAGAGGGSPLFLPLAAVSFDRRAALKAALRPQRTTNALHVDKIAFGLHAEHPLRAFCLLLVSLKFLGTAVFVALLLNLLVLFCTLDETEKATSFSAALRRAEVEYFLSSLFTFEFAVKVLALGLFGRRGFFYKYRPQRLLELLLVVFSWASLSVPGERQLAVVRALRTIRLLDFLDFMPEMSVIVATIVESVPMLLNVLLIIAVECLAFGLVALDLWRHSVDGTCGLTDVGGGVTVLSTASGFFSFPVNPPLEPTFCVAACPALTLGCAPQSCPAAWALAPAGLNTSSPSPLVRANVTCVMGTPTDWGSTSFENVAVAGANGFVMLSMEGWTGVMYRAMATSPQPALVAVIFVCHIILGTFIFLELALSVVVSAYVETVSREELRVGRLFMLLQLAGGSGTAAATAAAESTFTSTLAGTEGGGDGAPPPPPAAAVAKSMALWTEGRRLEDAAPGPMTIRYLGDGDGSSAATAADAGMREVAPSARDAIDLALFAGGFFDTSGGGDANARRRRRLSSMLDVPAATEVVRGVVRVENALHNVNEGRIAWMAAFKTRRARLRAQRAGNLTPAEQEALRLDLEADELLAAKKEADIEQELVDIQLAHQTSQGWMGAAAERYKRFVPYLCFPFAKETAHWIVRLPAFRVAVCLLVLTNAAIFAASGGGNSDETDGVLFYIHIVLLFLFLLEWIIKAVDKGPRLLFSTPFNCIDCALTVGAFLHAWSIDDLSIISVLRLMRVLYEVHLEMWKWHAMRLLVGSLGYAARLSVTSFTLLLVVLLTFSFAGMALFHYEGTMFDHTVTTQWASSSPRPTRMTYQTFGLAFITTFHVMDNENWDATVKAHVAVFGWTAVVFFSLLEILGNLLFLNLLIAMLLSSIDRFEEDTKLKLQAERARVKATRLKLQMEVEAAAGATLSPGAALSPGATALTATPQSKRARPLGAPAAKLTLNVYLEESQGHVDAMCLNIPPGAKEPVAPGLLDGEDCAWWQEQREARGVVTANGVMRVVPAGHPGDPAHPEFDHGTLTNAFLRHITSASRWVSAWLLPRALNAPRRLPAARSAALVAPAPPPAAPPAQRIFVPPAMPRRMGSAAGSIAARPDDGGGAAAPADGAREGAAGGRRSASAIARAILANPGFITASTIVLVMSCVNLAIDEPRMYPCADARTCALTAYLKAADFFFSAFFLAELLLACVSRLPNVRQLLDPWLLVDALVVAVTIAGAVLSKGPGSANSVRALRSARALRALLLIRRVPTLRLVVSSMVSALPRAKETVLVLLVLTVTFAVIGMSFLRRKLSVCNDFSGTTDPAACVGFFNVTGVRCEFLPTPEKAAACKSNPLGAPFPRLWEPLPESFDTFSNALLTMFELVSGENWPVLFWQMVDGLSGRGVNDFGGRGWMPGDPPNPLWAAIAYHMFIQTIMNQVILELFSGAILCRKAS